MVASHVCNSVGMRGMARVLQIAMATVLRLIKRSAEGIAKPPISLHQKSFEIDELRTFIVNKQKECWVAYVYAVIQKRKLI